MVRRVSHDPGLHGRRDLPRPSSAAFPAAAATISTTPAAAAAASAFSTTITSPGLCIARSQPQPSLGQREPRRQKQQGGRSKDAKEKLSS